MSWTYIIEDINGAESFGTFYDKTLKKTNQTEFRNGRVIKKGDKSYVKWKGYDHSLNSSIDKKRHSTDII